MKVPKKMQLIFNQLLLYIFNCHQDNPPYALIYASVKAASLPNAQECDATKAQ